MVRWKFFASSQVIATSRNSENAHSDYAANETDNIRLTAIVAKVKATPLSAYDPRVHTGNTITPWLIEFAITLAAKLRHPVDGFLASVPCTDG